MAGKKRKKIVPETWRSLPLTAAPAPHAVSGVTTRVMMGDVLIALVPALAVSTYFFGPRAIALAVVSMAAAVAFELISRLAMRRESTVDDLTALVTGLLLAMCLPVTAPYWVAVVGAGFSIVVVKQLYGGLGKNFLNPALAGRIFLFSYPVVMNLFVAPGVDRWVDWLGSGADAISSATPMASLAQRVLPLELSLRQMLLGHRGGSMGEVAAFALVLGGAYLMLRGVIRPRIPLCYLATVAALTYLLPFDNDALQWMLYHLLSGGLMLGALFMATDPVTSPVTPVGQVLYGIGCGGLTVFLRYFGAYPESVGFAILTMNACVWLLERVCKPRRYGTPLLPPLHKKAAAKAGNEGGDTHGG